MNFRSFFVALVLSFATVTVVEAQVIPDRYRVTRTSPGQTTIQHVFPKSSMVCDLTPIVLGEMEAGVLRIGDPERSTRDCETSGSVIAPIFANMLREIPYTYTIAAKANDIDPYSPESEPFVITLPRIPQIPGAPTNPRIVPPGTQGIVVEGVVQQRGFAFGLDVATTALFGVPNFPFYFGAPTLTTPTYSVGSQDRFVLQLWKP